MESSFHRRTFGLSKHLFFWLKEGMGSSALGLLQILWLATFDQSQRSPWTKPAEPKNNKCMLQFQRSCKSHLGILYDVNSNPCLDLNPHDVANIITVAALGHSPQSLCDELLKAATASQSCYCKAAYKPNIWVLPTKATDFCLMDKKKTALSVSSDSFYGSSEDTEKPRTSSLPEKAFDNFSSSWSCL